MYWPRQPITRRQLSGVVFGILVSCTGIGAVAQPGTDGNDVVVSDKCRPLSVHVPAPDVAYQPGIDIKGKAVVPADLGSVPAIVAPDRFTVDIDINLSDRFGIPGDPTFFDPTATVGTLSVRSLHNQPQLEFNGQLLPTTPELLTGKGCAD